MYNKYFGLTESPFSITPDPRYLYMSKRHREALAHLVFGINEGGGGFVQLTGEVGTGKTTLCRCLLEQLPVNVDIALILNPSVSPSELVANICDELRISYPLGTKSLKTLIDLLNQYLLQAHARGRRTVILIDEAQNLNVQVLEQVRLLTNLETERHKLLQIILVGQPELRALLERNDLRQVAQRITARYHLEPLSMSETVAYIMHRLRIAGMARPLFDAPALRKVHRLTGGVPRLINVVCDRSLLGAYAKDRTTVDAGIVTKAAKEVLGSSVLKAKVRDKAQTDEALFGVAGGAPHKASSATLLYVLAGIILVLAIAWLVWVPNQVDQSSAITQGDRPSNYDVAPKMGQLDADLAAQRARPSPAARPAQDFTDTQSTAAAGAPEVVDNLTKRQPISMQAADRELAGEVASDPDAEKMVETANIAALLQMSDDLHGEQAAFQRLFELWGIAYAPNVPKSPCEFAKSQQLRCLEDNGTWASLKRFHRPAILALQDNKGRRHRFVITALGEHTATLEAGDKAYRVPLQEIEPYWFGEFILLWKSPLEKGGVIGPGSFGEAVVWLRRQLDKVEGRISQAGESSYFDEGLSEQVKNFQRHHSLKDDGIVGPQTMIFINTATDTKVPLLRFE